MNKHTPGPWEFTTEFNGQTRDGVSGSIVSADAIFIAEIWDDYEAEPDDEATDGTPPAGTMTANARLIAAAPDLYSAIKDAMHYLDQTIGPCDEGCECILHALHAAIAKAEGDQPPQGQETKS